MPKEHKIKYQKPRFLLFSLKLICLVDKINNSVGVTPLWMPLDLGYYQPDFSDEEATV